MKTCLHVTEHLDPTFGGVAAIVEPLCSALQLGGRYRTNLMAFCDSSEQIPDALRAYSVERFRRGVSSFLYDRFLLRRVSSIVSAADLVHIHGLWREPSSVVAAVARSLAKPYIVSAHGMLDKWALQHKRFKKLLYGCLVERYSLKHAACLHALTITEVHDYRRFGLSNPVVLVPNGVTPPQQTHPDLFWTRYPELRSKRLFLFLGRLHKKKGVDLLCQAWASVTSYFPDAHLVFAGPDFDGTVRALDHLVARLNIRHTVTVLGMLNGQLKWSALAAASAFVLPSRSEGFSVAVLEAMATGCPVIISTQCHFADVAHDGCGWVVEPTTSALAAALREALNCAPTHLRAMGERARAIAVTRYGWSKLGAVWAEVYDWVIGGALPRSAQVLPPDSPLTVSAS